MRGLFIFLVTVASFFGCIWMLIVFANNMSKEHEETYDNMVGKKVLIDKDSLTVVDYSIIHETYTLSNGKTVSIKLFKK